MKLEILKALQKISLIPITNNQNVIACRDSENTRYYVFYSYNSLIAIYSENQLIINNDKWDYSKTTLKWFNYFLNNFTSFHFNSLGFKHDFTKEIINNKNIVLFNE